MTPETVVQTISQMFSVAFWVCAPLLVVGFTVSIVINIIQIVTSLQDATFSSIPRLSAFLGGFLFLLPWMLKKVSEYAISIFGDLGRYAH
jgi:flagellar biosynthetic protein FliQ